MTPPLLLDDQRETCSTNCFRRFMEVSENGDIETGKFQNGKEWVGMDLVANEEYYYGYDAPEIEKAGVSKILKKCQLPITGVNCVKK